MKKITYILVPFLVLASSCSKDYFGDFKRSSVNELRFSVATLPSQVKGELSQTTAFGVNATLDYAYTYLQNAKVEYSDDAWRGSPAIYWPVDPESKLSFNFYAPYSAAPWCSVQTKLVEKAKVTTLEASYTVTEEGMETIQANDLLYADRALSLTRTTGSVPVNFHHALAQVAINNAFVRFDDSIELGKITIGGVEQEIYCVYKQKTTDPHHSSESDYENYCSFFFLSGMSPASYTVPGTEYAKKDLCEHLENPIQNIWHIDINSIRLTNFAQSGTLSLSVDPSDSTKWAAPENGVWTVPADVASHSYSYNLIQDQQGLVHSKGYSIPLGTFFVIPQDLRWSKVLASQNARMVVNLNVRQYRAAENAANDAVSPEDPRAGIFDYRDIYQYYTPGTGARVLVDGETVKSGSFAIWAASDPKPFPGTPSVQYEEALIRKDATPRLDYTVEVEIPLYDITKSTVAGYANPEYLKMNTKTTYNINIDPVKESITFAPSVNSWDETIITVE